MRRLFQRKDAKHAENRKEIQTCSDRPEWIELLRRVLLKSRLSALLGELCRFALKKQERRRHLLSRPARIGFGRHLGGLKWFREFCDADGVADGLARPPESLGSNSQTLMPTPAQGGIPHFVIRPQVARPEDCGIRNVEFGRLA